MTDEELCAAGDVAALVARYREPLAVYCGEIARDPAAGDDLAQAVFLQLDQFPAGRLFRPWLYWTACRLARRHRKRLRRERKNFAEYCSTEAIPV